MTIIEPGRVCIKTKGRTAGKKVVVVGVEKEFAEIIGARMKKKKCNVRHLFVTEHKISIPKNATQEQVQKMLEGVKIG